RAVLNYNELVQLVCHVRDGIKYPPGTDFSYRDQVNNIRLATGANLPQVGLVRKAVGFFDAFNVLGLEVLPDDLCEWSQRCDGVATCGSMGGGRSSIWLAANCLLAPATQARAFFQYGQQPGRCPAEGGERHLAAFGGVRSELYAAFPDRSRPRRFHATL